MQPIQVHEKAIFHKHSSVEKSVSTVTPGAGSNKCRIVTVSSGSLGSTPSPSKSPPSVLDRPQMTPPSSWLRSTKFMWHHPPSAPLYMPGYPQGYGVSEQSYPQFFHSQNRMYMTEEIVSALIQESLTYLVPECCVPIFAVLSYVANRAS